MHLISRIIAITASILIIAGLSWLLFNGKLLDIQEVSKSFSQFIALEGADEYVVVRLVSNEEFTTEKYNKVLGFPVGDTNAKLSLVAHYKYYLKLGELRQKIDNGIVYIYVPKLYLSTPVAFDFSTVQENSIESLFGTNSKELLEQLKKEVSGELISKGKAQLGVVYDKAAKALADNFNSYFNANGYGSHYKNIVVIFSSERSQSYRQFSYNNSFCGNESCSLELDLGKGRVFTVK